MGTGSTGKPPAFGLLLTLLLAFGLSSPVSAAPPDFLLQIPETQTAPGEGAGELSGPRGIAADSQTGHVYIADGFNARISEYTAWGLFVKAWGWGVEDGSPELQVCGPAEPAEDPEPSLCQAGSEGSGSGQLARPNGLAVDSAGDVYVMDRENLRVQKFSSSGEFLLMFGGDVNKTKVEGGAPAAQRNRCPVDPGDVCQKGVSGEGPGQLSATIGSYIAYSPAENAILVGDKDGIQLFNLDGAFKKEIPFEGPALGTFAGETVDALDVDESGNVYFSLSNLADVFKLSSVGVPAAPGIPGETKFKIANPAGVAVDSQGGVYAIDSPGFGGDVWKYDAAGNQLVPTEGEESSGDIFPYVTAPGLMLTGLATNFCDGSEAPGSLYVPFFTQISTPQASYVNGYGTPPIGCESPPPKPPEISAQFATSVGREEAKVKAKINPRFWPDTSYFVEYGTGKCSEGGCGSKAPLSPLLLTGKSINAALTTATVVLEDLEPETIYHYRFVAQSGGGGPVFGIDPDGREGPAEASFGEGLEATFRTFRPDQPLPICDNDGVRLGFAKELPDCRAYEMVSPLDKDNGDVALWVGRNSLAPRKFELHQSAASGQRFTYTSAFAFAEPESAPFVSQYLAERDDSGWGNEALSPLRTEPPVNAESLFRNEFQGFSEDLCQAWLSHFSISTLAPDAIEKFPNLYKRDNCAEPPSYETLSTKEPHALPPDRYRGLRVHGFSSDGSHAIFLANDKLLDDAPTLTADDEEPLLYEHSPDGMRFVCYLPNGNPVNQTCAAGTIADAVGGIQSSVRNAISADGSRIFWSAYTGGEGIGDQSGTPGQIYVRIDGTETRKVSTTVASDPAWYWTAADDGSRAIFAFDSGPHKDELYEVDVDTETPTLIAKEVDGPMGASEDASRIYFASEEDLDETGPAATGDHNLYLYEADPGGGGGTYTFIMELGSGDLNGLSDRAAPVDVLPSQRAARVSPDGLHAAFTSVASPTPTGYDNLDANSGMPAQEVYLYDAVEQELRCVSCNPSGARPVGEPIGVGFAAAAGLQGWESLNHAPRVLSDDGTRVFFESFEALVLRDANSAWDVYQWEEESKGTCEASSETFVPESGGCVDLISAGESPAKSTFLDADPSGDNAFFSTQSTLVGADYGLNDVYVARVGGGFPEPLKETECEGEACQSPPPPPAEVTPASELVHGNGNANASKPRARRCPKGKRRVKRAGKVRCVKRKAKASRRSPR